MSENHGAPTRGPRPWLWSLAAVAVLAGVFLLLYRDFLFPLGSPALILFGDSPRQFFPWRLHAGQILTEWLSGQGLTLWNPYSGCGVDFVARLESALFYPPHLLLGLLLGKALSYATYQAVVLLHFFVYSLNQYLLCRELDCRRPAALIGGLCALGGCILVQWGHAPIHLTTVCWAPLMILFLHRALNRASWPCAALAGLFMAVSFSAGSGQMIFYVGFSLGLLWLVWAAWYWRQERAGALKLILLGAVVPLLGLLLSSLQLLPSAELTLSSHRATVDAAFAAIESSSYGHVAMWLGQANLLLGPLTLWLAVVGLFSRRDPIPLGLGLVALWSALYAVGSQGFLLPFMAEHLPLFKLFRFPVNSLAITNLALAPLAALGADLLLRGQTARAPAWLALGGLVLLGGLLAWAGAPAARLWPLPVVGALLIMALLAWKPATRLGLGVLCLVVGLVGLWSARPLPINSIHHPGDFYAPNVKVARFQGLVKSQPPFRIKHQGFLTNFDVRDSDPSIWLAGLVHQIPDIGIAGQLNDDHLGQLSLLSSRNLRLFDLLGVRYVLGPAGEAAPVSARYKQVVVVPGQTWRLDLEGLTDGPVERVDLASQLSYGMEVPQGQKVGSLTLVLADGATRSFPVRAGVETAEWAVERPGARPGHHRAKVERSWPVEGGNFQGHDYAAAWNLDAPARVKAIILRNTSGRAHWGVNAIALDGRPVTGPTLAMKELSPGVWENPYYLPRAFVVRQTKAVAQDEAARQAVAGLDPSREVVLDREPAAHLPGEPCDRAAPPRVLREHPEKTLVRVCLDKPGILVLTDTYNTNWKARDNGRDIEMLRADLMFRGFALGPGRHELVLTYEPWWPKLGLALTGLGLALFAGLLVLGRTRRRKDSRRAAP